MRKYRTSKSTNGSHSSGIPSDSDGSQEAAIQATGLDRRSFDGTQRLVAACSFGEGTSMYDNVLARGDVGVGKNTWIGPIAFWTAQAVSCGSGTGGDMSAGAQIYTHHTVNRSTSLGAKPIDRASTKIGDGVCIGPNAIIEMGVTIQDGVIVGANSLVNRDVPSGAEAMALRRAFKRPPNPLKRFSGGPTIARATHSWAALSPDPDRRCDYCCANICSLGSQAENAGHIRLLITIGRRPTPVWEDFA
jgi:carbonic anhydrase/acetyltransferase-like protein (isoleucine patch superfamily)